MRIRKRQLPLPTFSSLSDPPVQLPLPSSDPPINPLDNNQKQKLLQQYDSRETILIGAETINNALLPHSSSSSSQGGGRWCEKEKAFPLKKRRGSFERSSDEDNDDHSKDSDHQVATKLQDEKKMMKTKMNKKCTLSQKQSKVGLDAVVGKKRSRGGALMEGSRCSRVNGRGWRCCQQTLVGYSLCEHHLGKGRLRSMNNVRNRSLVAATPKNIVVVEKDEKKPSPSPPPSPFPSSPPPPSSFSLTSKKRMKLGVVKARSMSSLLGQPEAMAVATPLSPPSTLHDDNIDK
ncbi:uncharacterized protein LOC101223014 isoform X2 [Cucumis sativus]|uniref:WRC domain-containing protein n=1 Tax=Cucumis sativus TaxID=3659 RepID=A0A0A0LGX5_CUCSA|nr:uncharacterized protein LOC101223014 isoform X2 [Cucumis sativus]